MTTLILHIGRDRTGSTSIQHNLHRDSSLLRQFGVLYPSTGLAREAHHLLGHSICSQIPGDEQSSSSFMDLLEQLNREIKGSNCRDVILSTETLCLMPRMPSNTAMNRRLVQLLALFDEVRILCCVRHQAPAIESSYRFGVKWESSAYSWSFDEYVNKAFGNQTFVYSNIELFFNSVYPGNHFEFWSFSEAAATGDIVHYFYNLCGISSLYREAERVNESLSRESTLAILEWNRSKQVEHHRRRSFVEWSQKAFPQADSSLYSLELLTRVVESYADSNAALEQHAGIRFLDVPDLSTSANRCLGQDLSSNDLNKTHRQIRR